MSRKRRMRAPLVLVLMVGAMVALLTAIGCFGGSDDGSSTTQTSQGPGGSMPDSGETTTLVAVVDPLSSFNSKDPFIPQAQLTTTTAAPTTTGFTTTTAGVTTTQPHRLRVNAFPGGGAVSFSIDSVTFNGISPSTGLFIGGWGTIQLVSVNDTVAPYSASFKRAGSIDFTLYLNQTRTW